jgi:uncharacterized NAD(P)/FAD-binding protein YdhS
MADAGFAGLGPDHTIVIVGGGFSGTLLAINLARFGGPRTILIERRAEQVARGVAYSTPHPSQLLNVRAGGMSAWPDRPDHFAKWVTGRGGTGSTAFVPRALYGAYLREMLIETGLTAGDRLVMREGEVCDVVYSGAGVEAVLADGTRIAADAAVLAVGNLPPHDPPGIDGDALPADLYVRDPWRDDPTVGLTADDRVLLLGTGLTAVDVALALDASGFGGEIVALSRRGLAPRRHMDGQPPVKGLWEPPSDPLSRITADVRAKARDTGDWRGAIDALRPVTQRLWAGASDAERARFLRHLRPFWDVHRHRLAPVVADRIEALVEAGRLSFRAGKTASVTPEASGLRLDWRPRHRDAIESLHVRRIVNCTGPQGDLTRSTETLLRTLATRGAIRPDRLRLGVDVDVRSRVIARDGAPDQRLFCVGPMTRGGSWEIVAVPDLRRQSWDVARRLANAHWVGGEGL